jgi:hypothetical protein
MVLTFTLGCLDFFFFLFINDYFVISYGRSGGGGNRRELVNSL